MQTLRGYNIVTGVNTVCAAADPCEQCPAEAQWLPGAVTFVRRILCMLVQAGAVDREALGAINAYNLGLTNPETCETVTFVLAQAEAVDRQALGAINAYNPGLSGAWMLQRAMSLRVGQQQARRLVAAGNAAMHLLQHCRPSHITVNIDASLAVLPSHHVTQQSQSDVSHMHLTATICYVAGPAIRQQAAGQEFCRHAAHGQARADALPAGARSRFATSPLVSQSTHLQEHSEP